MAAIQLYFKDGHRHDAVHNSRWDSAGKCDDEIDDYRYQYILIILQLVPIGIQIKHDLFTSHTAYFQIVNSREQKQSNISR